MLIHDDLSQSVIVDTTKLDWVPSPAKGVDRRMLFRIGGEVARATSIVRYAPGSAFPRHVHGGGEEILVLDGTFQDEHGNYPAGSYCRNPPGTSHVPAAKDGCTILVRLWQFRQRDSKQIVQRPGEGKVTIPRDGASRSWSCSTMGTRKSGLRSGMRVVPLAVRPDCPDGGREGEKSSYRLCSPSSVLRSRGSPPGLSRDQLLRPSCDLRHRGGLSR